METETALLLRFSEETAMKPVVKILIILGTLLSAGRLWADPMYFEGPKDTVKGVRSPAVADHIDFNGEGYSNPLNLDEEMIVPLHFSNVPTQDYLLGLSDQNNWTAAGPDVFFKAYPFSHEAGGLVAPWMVEHDQLDSNGHVDLAVIVHQPGNPNANSGGLWVGLNFDGQSVQSADWSFHPTPCQQDPVLVATHLTNISRQAAVPTWVQMADTDNDGDTDIVVSTTCGEIHTFLNGGSGNFATTADYVRKVDPPAADAAYPFITSFVLKKFDGDAFPDIAAVAFSYSPGPATLFLNGSNDGKFSSGAFKVIDKDIFECFWPTHIIAADLNGDSVDDLAVACPFDYQPNALVGVADETHLKAPVLGSAAIRSGHVYVYLATAATDFGQPEPNVPDQILTNSVYFPMSVAAGKFNSDSHLDLGVANVFDRDTTNHLNEGSITFHDNVDGSGKNYDDILGTTYAKYMGFHPTYGFTSEVNEDGRDDYAVSSYGSRRNLDVAGALIPSNDAFQVLVNTVPPDITVQEPTCSTVASGEITVTFKIHDADGGDQITSADVTVNPPVDSSKIIKSALPAIDATVSVTIPVAGSSHVTISAKDSTSKESHLDWDYDGHLVDCGKTSTSGCPAQPLEFEAFQGKMGSVCAPETVLGGANLQWSQTSGQSLQFDIMGMKGVPPSAGSCLNFVCAVDSRWSNYDVALQYEVLNPDGTSKFVCPATGICMGAALEGSGTLFSCSLGSGLEASSGEKVSLYVMVLLMVLGGQGFRWAIRRRSHRLIKK